MTFKKSGAQVQELINAKKGTVWWDIYHNHMDEDSFMGLSSLNVVYHSTKSLVAWVSSSFYLDFSRKHPCELKMVWQERQATPDSFGFPKNSPLLPYFNGIMQQNYENGILHSLLKKWNLMPTKSTCVKDLGNFDAISFHKVVLLFPLFAGAMLLAFVLLSFEKILGK